MSEPNFPEVGADAPVAIDLFCGAGGLSLGFAQAGFDIAFACDLDTNAIKSHRHNLGPHAFSTDIYNVNRTSIESLIGHQLGSIDIVMGGPPCQGFSVQRRGSDVDDRNELVLEFIRLVLELRPHFFMIENVSGLLSTRGRSYMEQIVELVKSGPDKYILHTAKLNAAHYGVAQERKRVIIVGERSAHLFGSFEYPQGESDRTKWRTVRMEIYELACKSQQEIYNHRADKLSAMNLERIRSLVEGQGRDSLPEHLQLPCQINNQKHRHLDTYGRMAWDALAPTITARFDSFSRGRFGHPDLDRTITLREGARLQSFPDDFVFFGSKVEIARQIGNAVPPRMARAIAETLKRLLRPTARMVEYALADR